LTEGRFAGLGSFILQPGFAFFVLRLVDAKSMLDEGSEGNFLLGCIIVEASLKLRLEFCEEKMSADRVIQDSEV